MYLSASEFFDSFTPGALLFCANLRDPRLKLWMESNLVIKINFPESTLTIFKFPTLFNSVPDQKIKSADGMNE